MDVNTLFAKSGISSTGTTVTTLIAAIASFTGIQLTTGHLWLALFTAIASAGIANWPRIIKARSDSVLSERTLTHNETTKVIERLDRDNEALTAKLDAVRMSKHKILNECQHMSFHIETLHIMLREKGVEPPPFRRATIEELMGDEDRVVAKITNGDGKAGIKSKILLAIGTLFAYAVIGHVLQPSVHQKSVERAQFEAELVRAKKEAMQHTGR